MNRKTQLLSIPLLLLVCVAPVSYTATQSDVFPRQLLEGTQNFQIAFVVHGDLRGNYGPCG